MARVLVSETIAEEGLDLLRAEAEVDVRTGLSPDELKEILPQYHALVARSETKVTSDVIAAGTNLQVVGRAGVGLDNIDVESATARGVAVVNAPSGNIVAAAEHTMALMLALSRNVPQAHASLIHGEWARRAFMGVEIRGKVLGIVGLGRVGSEVVRMAKGFAMRLLGFDPFVSSEYAANLGVELATLDSVLAQADYVTLHTPLIDSTRQIIDKASLAKMKPGARLINVARGELVNEEDLLAALQDGNLAGAALDVFAKEPPGDSKLLKHPKVIATPHLGASTEEAQREVSIEVAEQVLAVLRGSSARYSVNTPFLPPEVNRIVAPFATVGKLVGKLVTLLAEGQFGSIDISYEGEIAEHETTALQAAVLVGVLTPITTERVNEINASITAQRRGLRISERKDHDFREYGSLISVTVHTSAGDTTVSGMSMRGEVHVVRVNQYWLDMVPSVPYLLFIEHNDRPGMIGTVGTITGTNDVNIAFMEVGRLSARGQAMMILGLDDPLPSDVLKQIKADPYIEMAKVVRL